MSKLQKRKSKVLVIAAHPDDEILGCGGSMAQLVSEGSEVHVVILGEGVTSRFVEPSKANPRLLQSLKKESFQANKILGTKKMYFCDLPDNRFDTVPLLDIIKQVETIKKRVNPSLVFVHHPCDCNVDHHIAYEASIVAFRPLPGETARTLLAFEVPGSTQRMVAGNIQFSANYYFNIEKVMNKKIKALQAYGSEMRTYPHPRSISSIKVLAQSRGIDIGLKCAEGFQLIRHIC